MGWDDHTILILCVFLVYIIKLDGISADLVLFIDVTFSVSSFRLVLNINKNVYL